MKKLLSIIILAGMFMGNVMAGEGNVLTFTFKNFDSQKEFSKKVEVTNDGQIKGVTDKCLDDCSRAGTNWGVICCCFACALKTGEKGLGFNAEFLNKEFENTDGKVSLYKNENIKSSDKVIIMSDGIKNLEFSLSQENEVYSIMGSSDADNEIQPCFEHCFNRGTEMGMVICFWNCLGGYDGGPIINNGKNILLKN